MTKRIEPERIKCDQCEAVMINGVFCHETGCPNLRAVLVNGEWVRMKKCFECGCYVPVDVNCCNGEDWDAINECEK